MPPVGSVSTTYLDQAGTSGSRAASGLPRHTGTEALAPPATEWDIELTYWRSTIRLAKLCGMNQQPNLWDERYGNEGFVFGTEPNDFLRDSLSQLQPGAVCCIGDGEGRNGVFLARAGFSVTSVDLSAVGLAKAAKLADSHGVALSTIVSDLGQWVGTAEAAGPWNDVVSIFCHMPSAVRAVVYPKLIAAMAPGAVFLLEAYTPDQIGRGTGGPGDPDLLLTASQARQELDGLMFEHLEELERNVVEGELHTGTAVVVQCIARKA